MASGTGHAFKGEVDGPGEVMAQQCRGQAAFQRPGATESTPRRRAKTVKMRGEVTLEAETPTQL